MTAPTVTITTPMANAHLSNQMATVTGKASDNVSVASVSVSTDGVNWLPANGTTNWTTSVSLNPSANTILAYAVDGSGNVSVTNRVNVTYIVSGSLTVNLNGRGTITPNYTNATLQVGNRYTITATPAAGFAFTNWTAIGGVSLTNKPTINFLMQDGLVFYASFVDVQKPTVNITNIPANGKWSNSQFTASGKAGDNVLVANVFYNLNGAGFSNAGINSGNNLTNWNVGLTLVPGSNTIAAYAQDAAGNVSLTNTVRLTYILSAPLTVNLSGRGTTSPNYNNASLQISNRYTMTATPAAGFIFTNWTDGGDNLLTNKPALSFVMASNLSFTAHFLDVQKPVLTVTTPTAATIATNSILVARGTASDNSGAQTIFIKINNSGWFSIGIANNWQQGLDLPPGTNYFAAYAVDAAGNVSATNNTKFLYTTAPASLNGQLAKITPDGGTPFGVAFGATTFSQASADTNNVNTVGKYTYTKQTPFSGVLKLTYLAPPSTTNDGSQTIDLAFAAPLVARFTNNTDTGGIVFSLTSTLLPTTLANRTIVFVNNQGEGGTARLTASQIIDISLQQITNHIRNYTFTPYSPVGGLIKQTGSNYLSYATLNFANTNYGQIYSEEYDSSNNFRGSSLAVFGFASQRVGGNAPTNLINRTAVITTDAGAHQLILPDGSNFTDLNPLDNTVVNGTGTYTYGTTGTNSAALNLTYTSSATAGFLFQFVSPNFAIFTNSVDGTIGAAVVK